MINLRKETEMGDLERKEAYRGQRIIFINRLIEMVKANKRLPVNDAHDMVTEIANTMGWCEVKIKGERSIIKSIAERLMTSVNYEKSKEDKLELLMDSLQRLKPQDDQEARARERLTYQYHAAVSFVKWYEAEFSKVKSIEFV